MVELSVSSRLPSAITVAFKRIRDMVMQGDLAKTTPVHIVLEPGTYRETLKYNLSNPLILECTAKNADCIIQADNCEAFHRGLENRSVFFLGANATSVTLRNFSIINTHNKSANSNEFLDSAEALVWANENGTLFAENLRLEGRQNTLCAKGTAHFLNCTISGDTDFIYGEPTAILFEKCQIIVREDNRANQAFAVKSLALAGKTGFVFSNCDFSSETRGTNQIYLYRTAGNGSADTKKDWDSAAFINCTVSDSFDQSFAWDDDLVLNIYPRGNAKTGLREYGTKIRTSNGTILESDTTLRNIKFYTLTDDDYYKFYASRYLILQGTPLE